MSESISDGEPDSLAKGHSSELAQTTPISPFYLPLHAGRVARKRQHSFRGQKNIGNPSSVSWQQHELMGWGCRRTWADLTAPSCWRTRLFLSSKEVGISPSSLPDPFAMASPFVQPQHSPRPLNQLNSDQNLLVDSKKCPERDVRKYGLLLLLYEYLIILTVVINKTTYCM